MLQRQLQPDHHRNGDQQDHDVGRDVETGRAHVEGRPVDAVPIGDGDVPPLGQGTACEDQGPDQGDAISHHDAHDHMDRQALFPVRRDPPEDEEERNLGEAQSRDVKDRCDQHHLRRSSVSVVRQGKAKMGGYFLVVGILIHRDLP